MLHYILISIKWLININLKNYINFKKWKILFTYFIYLY